MYMPCLSISNQIISAYEAATLIHRQIRSATLMGRKSRRTYPDPLQLAQRVMAKSHGLYHALTTGTDVPAAPENVENLNYLQCSWAHGAVYANRKDFSFAKRVFREQPQYRNSPRTSLMVASPSTFVRSTSGSAR
jgi:hypothetical protein